MAPIRVKSADRVIQILEVLASCKWGMQHKDLAGELEIPKGSLTKLLANLLDSGYLTYDSAGKLYRLGPRVLTLADSYLCSIDIVQAAQPIVRDLAATTGESCGLSVYDGDSAVLVHRQYGSHPMSYRLGIGARIPLYATASGKVILAFMVKEELQHYVDSVEMRALTHATITDASSLLRELESVRSEGIAYCWQEQFEGLSAIAAPVFRVNGRVGGAIAVMFLNIRTESINFSTLKDALGEASDSLSGRLGFRRA